jgi:hypothetical protein
MLVEGDRNRVAEIAGLSEAPLGVVIDPPQQVLVVLVVRLGGERE